MIKRDNHFGGSIQNRKEFDFGVIGIPFDEKSSYLKGASKGPEAIRASSTDRIISAWTELDVNLREDCVVAEMGDVEVSGEYSFVIKNIENAILNVLEKNAIPIALGGDHSITFPIVKAMAKKYNALDILHFDAHPDLYHEYLNDLYSHACPFKRILENGLVCNLVQVGIRGFIGEHMKIADQYGVRMIRMKEIPPLPDLVFNNPLYISIDVDVLDPAFAPGVSHHEPGGISTRQLIQMIHSIEADIVGLDVVEVNPERDYCGITAAAAAKLAMEVMGKVIFDKINK